MLPTIDKNNIYCGMVEGLPGDISGSLYAPKGVPVSLLGPPPTDEPGKWRDNGAAWLAVTAEDIHAARLAEIDARLTAIDVESIRPLRAVADGSATDYDRQKLAALEAEAARLRAERAESAELILGQG